MKNAIMIFEKKILQKNVILESNQTNYLISRFVCQNKMWV